MRSIARTSFIVALDALVVLGLMLGAVGFANAQDVTFKEVPVKLSWNKNPEPDVQYYKIYFGSSEEEARARTNPPILIGPNSPADLPDVVIHNYTAQAQDGTEGSIYYVITAEDTSGNESKNSTEVAVQPYDFLAPSPPTGLALTE